MSARPRVFVASSKEAEPWVAAVKANLEEVAEVTPWTYAFRISRNTIDELVRNLDTSDFGVFVLAPDDIAVIRGEPQHMARDNVILELGMFIGRLGKEKSFILTPKSVAVRVPSDLRGLDFASYEDHRADGNFAAACTTPCHEIKEAIKRQMSVPFEEVHHAVTKAVKTICSAMSVPKDPQKSSLRVFVFREEGEELVCKYFHHSDAYAPVEGADRTRVKISSACAEKIVVVKCFLENVARGEKFAVTASAVQPLDKASPCVTGDIKRDLTYVLAAPIVDRRTRSVWGVVDFDASNEMGAKLLEKAVSRKVVEDLAEYLGMALT